MDTRTIDLRMTVEQVLQEWPQAFYVFLKHRTKCAGCFMQAFCTLKSMAETYQLSLEALVDDIKCASEKEDHP